MKKIIRLFLISVTSIWLTNKWFPDGLVITGTTFTLLEAGLALMLSNALVKPLFSLIMLPINLLTFGLFRWVTNVVMLYLVINFVNGISVQPFYFTGINYAGVVIPQMEFELWMAWIFIPFIVSCVSGFLIWLVKK